MANNDAFKIVAKVGGDEGVWTLDPQIANLVLSQLSYVPMQYSYYNQFCKLCKSLFIYYCSRASKNLL